MTETPGHPPTAATTRFDGGHPAIELVNTIYGQVGAPPEHDMLVMPEDLVILSRRLGLAEADTPAGAAALTAAHALRKTVDALLRARVTDVVLEPGALAALELAARDALAAATLRPHGGALVWAWPSSDAYTPVHRFAYAALELLGDEAELSRLRQCDGCCWLFLDHSRGAGRRWCSMEWCGGEAKKRRYVQRRRERRADANER
jgi:predicted RNA-binding Zn ribbon-like protein